MDTPIRNLDFDSSGDNTEFGIHRCANSDGDSSCSFGITSWNAGDGHRVYFGKSVSGFGKDGCPNPECVEQQKTLKLQINELRASIAVLDRAILATPVQAEKITLGIRRLGLQATLDAAQAALQALPCSIRDSNSGRSVGDADPNGGASPDSGGNGGQPDSGGNGGSPSGSGVGR